MGRSGDWEWRVTWREGDRSRERDHRNQTEAMAAAGWLTGMKERGATFSDIRVWRRKRTPWEPAMQSRYPGGD